MNNNLRKIYASTCLCKAIPSIEVNSDKYNSDKNYKKSINQVLTDLKKKK
jgi:hypothetical protein